jgi:hypothetical protein
VGDNGEPAVSKEEATCGAALDKKGSTEAARGRGGHPGGFDAEAQRRKGASAAHP